jgi:hypothetical protein
MTMFVSFPRFRAEDGNGVPLVGGKVYTYDPGTTNAKATYSDKGLSVANTNPVILDARGEADIYCGSAVKLVVKDADDVTLTSTDDWESVASPVTLTGTQTLTNKTLTSPVINGGTITTGDASITGGDISDVTITGGTIDALLTPIAVVDGGTGASTAAAALTNLGLTATAAEVNAAADGVGVTIPRQKVVEIGDWDMDTDAYMDVTHGLTLAKIISVRGVVRNDTADTHYQLQGLWSAAGAPDSAPDIYISSIDATNVRISRRGGSIFDYTTFDSTSFNRGWIIVDYLD